jgi:hypothetical protein
MPADGDHPAARAIRIGDRIQWCAGGVDQFPTMQVVVGIGEHDGDTFVFVEGQPTGIPIDQVVRDETRPAKPPPPNVPAIPRELIERPQWVVWRYEYRDGRWTKMPYRPGRPKKRAKAGNPATWGTFELAWAAYEAGDFDGIGYEFSPDDPFFGGDIDHCLVDGEVQEWAIPFLDKLEGTYGEVSPSGTGIKFFGIGKLPADKGTRRPGFGPDGSGAIELYDHARFFTVTGIAWNGPAIVDRQSAAVELYAIAKRGPAKPTKPAKPAGQSGFVTPVGGPAPVAAGGERDDGDVLAVASRSAGFGDLYGGSIAGFQTQSEADFSLINRLAFFCGPGREDQVKRLFLASELGKRDKSSVRADYVDRSIAKAYAGRTEFFGWGPPPAIIGPSTVPAGTPTPAPGGPRPGGRPEISNCRRIQVKDQSGETRDVHEPRTAMEIADHLAKIAGGWPRRLEEIPFVQGPDFRPIFLEGSTQLFGYVDGFASVYWIKGANMVTQERFYEYVRKFRAERFKAIERYPHFPLMPDTYYMHPPIRSTKDKVLIRQFLDFFQFATDVDRSLAESLLLTLFWGGPPGLRPCFLVRGPEDDDPALMGRSVGKTILAALFASLAGGLLDLLEGEEIPDVKTRLLSDEGMEKRVLRIDNVKTVRLSWAALEQFITSDVVSGKKLYHGEGSRPNTITTIITMNGGSLSKDMATRVIIIRLARPPADEGWRQRVVEFIDRHRWDLIAEIRGQLEDERGSITPRGRWPEWQVGVLGKVKDYIGCQEAISGRSEELDSDNEAATVFEEEIHRLLEERKHDPDLEHIKIPPSVMGVWYSRIHKAHVAAKTATERLELMPLKRLRYRRKKSERFWQWSGTKAVGDPLKPVELKSEGFNTRVNGGIQWGE